MLNKRCLIQKPLEVVLLNHSMMWVVPSKEQHTRNLSIDGGGKICSLNAGVLIHFAQRAV